jgi:DNA helicase-2/ATP-dependent DNA helicase PcrA
MSAGEKVGLNDKQQQIVRFDIGETVKAMAGAGTGKTRVLVERYLKFVFDDRVPPGRLLALTFTTKAASEMRKRIFDVARARGDTDLMRELYAAWIMNFHQFSFRVISENASEFGIDPDIGVATDVDAARIRTALYRRFQAGKIDGMPDGFDNDMPPPGKLPTIFDRWMRILQRARGTLWTPDALTSCIGSDDTPEYTRYIQSIVALWNAYEGELNKRNLIDFNDMIALVVWGLRENKRLRRLYCNKFQHILVDEFQDTSEAQNEVLRALAGDDFARVTVVGDDKQSIYRWRDARVQNLREFVGQQEELCLNYRSRQNILDLAHHFVIQDSYFSEHADEIRLRAARGQTDAPVCLFHPADEHDKSFEEEAKGLTAWILSLSGGLKPGESPFSYYSGDAGGGRRPLEFDEIAVLMRSLKPSSGLPEFEKAFRRAGIPYAVCGGVGSLEVRVLQLYKNLLRLLVYPEDIHALISVLEARPFSLPDLALKELFDEVEPPFGTATLLSDENCSRLTDVLAQASCQRLRWLISTLVSCRNQLDFPAFVVDAFELSHFFFRFFDDGADVALVESVTKTLFGMVEALVTRNEGNLTAFLESLEVLLAKKSLEESRGPVFPPGRVRVMTVHSAKGLEFPAVAVPGIKSGKNTKGEFYLSRKTGLFVNDGKEWGRGVDDSGAVDTGKADREQEERCLIYVAITRARDHLFVSTPFPGGVQQKKTNLFADILRAVEENKLQYEELRTAPVIERPGILRTATTPADDEDVRSLLDRWSKGRKRLSAAAQATALPIRGIEFVNWSELYAFSICPLRFYYRHVVGASRGLLEETTDSTKPSGGAPRAPGAPGALDARAMGVFLHDYLCEHMSVRGRDDEPIAKGIDEFAKRYGFNKTQHRKAVQQATKRLNEFAKTPLAERSGELWAERPVRARLDRLVFRAVFDRVDPIDDGYRVVDYKLETERDKYAYQVQFYTWVLRELGKKNVSEALLCYLQVPTKIVPVDISRDAIAAIDRDARGLEAAVTSGRFDPCPGEVCDDCIFNKMCPAADVCA